MRDISRCTEIFKHFFSQLIRVIQIFMENVYWEKPMHGFKNIFHTKIKSL